MDSVLISSNKNNRDNFSGEKSKWSFPGCLIFENTQKNCKSNLVLVLESKGLNYGNQDKIYTLSVMRDFNFKPYHTIAMRLKY